MHVEAAVLWSLTDMKTFRCPYHANDPRREGTPSAARDDETPA